MLGFGSGKKKNKRPMLLVVPPECVYCPQPAQVFVTWPDGEAEHVCAEHGRFISQSMAEITVLTSLQQAG